MTTKIATKNALAAELERLFSGLPSAVPRRWVMGDRTGYTPVREACPDCPPRSKEGSAWNLHARAKGEEVLARGGSKKAARAAEKAEKERHNVAWHAGHWRMHVTAGEAHYLGVYTVVPQESGATTGLVAIDLDDHGGQGDLNPHGRLEGLADSAEALGVGCAFFGNTSRGGKGRHARLCVDPSTPAWLAREIGLRWLDHAGITPRPAPGSPEEAPWLERFGEDPDGVIEVYPKQDGEKGGYGNLLGLPCSLDLMAEGRTAPFAPGSWEPIREAAPALEVLRAVRPLTPDEVRELATRLGINPDTPPKRKPKTKPKPKAASKLRPRGEGIAAQVTRERIAFLDHDPEEDTQRAREALKLIPADSYDDWLAVGMALEGSGLTSGRALWDEWASASEKFDADAQEDKWHSFSGSGRSLGTLFKLAKEHGWDRRDFYRARVAELLAAAKDKAEAALEPRAIYALRQLTAPEREKAISELKAANRQVRTGEVRAQIKRQAKREKHEKILAARGDAPQILVDTQIKSMTDEAERVLARRCLTVYQRGGELVRVLELDDGTKAIGALSLASLAEELSEAASWIVDHGEEGLEPVYPPRAVVEALHARGNWEGVRIVRDVVTAPCLCPDGTVIQGEARYDPAARVIFDPDGEFPQVPESPSRDDARRALRLLKEPLADFCFVDPCDESAALALILTAVGRSAISGPCPMFLIRATTPGSGKGLLANVAGTIASGAPLPPSAAPRTPDEERKQLTSWGIEGRRLVLLDNIEGGIGSDVLAAALTSETWRDRVLGSNRVAEVRVPLLIGTGNNVAVRGDLARRVIPVDLDPGVERPEEREDFRHPQLLEFVKLRRREFLVAALTVLRWFYSEGCPAADVSAFGSFESWSGVVRAALAYLGEPDPATGRIRIRESGDPQREADQAALEAWHEVVGGHFQTTGDLVRLAAKSEGLAEALAGLCPKLRSSDLDTKPLGQALRRLQGRILGGLKVVRGRRSRDGLLWQVVAVGEREGIGA